MAHDDFMPIEGWDHVELWVGNAKQSAYFYEHAIGLHACRLRRPRDRRPRPCVVRARAGPHPLRRHERPARGQRGRALLPRPRRRREGRRADRPGRDRGVPAGGAARGRLDQRAALDRGRARPRRARHDRHVRRDRAHVRQPLRVRGPRTCPATSRSRTTAQRAKASGYGRSTTLSATSSSGA